MPAAASSSRVGPRLATLFTLAFALGGWRSGLSRLSDNSFFWHLRTGGEILDHWVPRDDPYSFTAPGINWVAQSWLAEALYGLIDRTIGAFGVRLLGAVTGALVAGLAYRLALRLTRDRVRALGIALAAVGASFTLWSERPLFLGILALVGLLWIVEVPDSWLGRRPLVAVPVLMWLWANVHGTFALGFAYLALHLAGRWLDGRGLPRPAAGAGVPSRTAMSRQAKSHEQSALPWQGRERSLAMAMGVAVLACLVNPYGPALLLFPVELLSRGDILKHVTEWRSPDFRSAQGLTFAAWITVFVVTLGLARRRPSRRDLVVSLPFLLLGLWAQRNIALAPFVGLPVVARALAASEERPEPASRLNRPIGALILALAVLWTGEAAGEPDFSFAAYPVKAMRAVESQGLLGRNLMTDDAWGGYVVLRYWPEQRVFIDDRYDMYPKDLTRDFIRFSDGDRRWDEILDRYRVEVVVWERNAAVAQLLERDPDWERVHRDKLAVVYVRRDLAG